MVTARKQFGSGPVRKRYWITRARAKRSRPKTPAPKGGWTIAELARLTGLSIRTLRHYVTVGILRPIEYRGTSTRYARRELLRLLRALSLRAHCAGKRFRLSDAKRTLEGLSDPELEAWVNTMTFTPELAAALNAQGAVSPAGPSTARAHGALALPTGMAVTGAPHVETWQRVQLLPGLELSVSSDASPAVRSIAAKILEDYLSAPR